ncbi:MAG: PDZ domain-containing protein, partial [Thermomicrobiales bacterium]|nr:PDZ domain-containing protein [Thermomicrobiales bacterium]
IVDEIIQTGRVAYPFFGVSYVPISPDLAAQHDLSVDYGAYVQGVEPGGAADRAGIREGDIIVAVGDDRITAQTTFTEALFAHSPGETVPVTVIRNGREQTLPTTLAERPRD